MRVSTNFALPLSAVLFGLLLIPRAALAAVNNCPVEPAQNVPIADGGIFTGPNCNLYTVGDVDSFVFNANNGDTYQLVAAVDNGSHDICLTLYDPNNVDIFSGCTYVYPFGAAVLVDQPLTVTGKYTMVITETSASYGTQNYAVSLQRLYPAPPNAVSIPKLGQVLTGVVTPLTASDPFTFTGATTGTYRATATLPAGSTQNLCMSVYNPDGSSAGSGCSNVYPYGSVVTLDFMPPHNGTIMVLLAEYGYDGTLGYTTGTLSMNFTVENSYATTWNIWLTDQNAMQLLYSKSQPITVAPTAVPMTTTLSPEGNVGVLSTLTTPTGGITCSSWEQVQTGAP